MVVYFGFRPETGCAKNRGVKTLVGGNHRWEVLPASGSVLHPAHRSSTGDEGAREVAIAEVDPS
jgi:hypothetical protein